VSSAPRMHADELDVDVPLVRRLLAAQFPAWAGLPLEPVLPRGTDHAIFRLGEGMSVRLPRIEWANGQAEKEAYWLPRLAPHLPLAIPRPLALGEPALGYPWRWCIHTWLPGEPASIDRIADPVQAARDAAGFIAALHQIDTSGAPEVRRGWPLATWEEPVRAAIRKLASEVDAKAVTAVYDAALAATPWERPPVWIHADLDSRNLLACDGRLSGLVDFGGLGIGDPACDLGLAWKLFSGEAREVFRAALRFDEATWARSRGHTVAQAVMALSYYTVENNAVLFLAARRWLDEVLSERA
jgi:aminoglycoside phosphotransferase (APT) family kinase protein